MSLRIAELEAQVAQLSLHVQCLTKHISLQPPLSRPPLDICDLVASPPSSSNDERQCLLDSFVLLLPDDASEAATLNAISRSQPAVIVRFIRQAYTFLLR